MKRIEITRTAACCGAGELSVRYQPDCSQLFALAQANAHQGRVCVPLTGPLWRRRASRGKGRRAGRQAVQRRKAA